ncbi:uncharacterized protein J7T54_008204 [Emericellopsis cladophorae]|uniref:NADP-dependent oxidoreductase domain-containing protein n=1 Tax=Emericellopsis cladophorae TaxID=2686198 RepID=A0A9Q0BCC2_9HYPO|nr:uncharacterized protein J7T54_008204 [Emericellopsis cladophorae]KAI6779586.1 hypothetical protein J7T54_008204 [Emericellopsis cladophorae]
MSPTANTPVASGLMRLANLPSEEDALAAIKTSIDNGSTYLNAAEFYGPPDYGSLYFLARHLERHPEDAGKITLNVKGALNTTTYMPDAAPDKTRQSIANCLRLLEGRVPIHQFAPARVDPDHDILDTLAVVNEYVQAGKIGAIGLSEVSEMTLRRVAAKYKVATLEIEFSLFRTEPLSNGLLAACAELGVTVLAYSPLGKGLLGGQFKKVKDIPENDMRRHFPQFSADNLAKNLELVGAVEELAKKKGCTAGQIAIGWILDVAKRPCMPTIYPLQGSGNPSRIKENLAVVDLSAEDVAQIDEFLKDFVGAGSRYPERMMTVVDQ